jgi:hypothetical protein
MTPPRQPLPDFIEDVEDLLSCRTWPPEIATRLGYTSVTTLVRRLHRAGRLDLAAQFNTYAHEARKVTR